MQNETKILELLEKILSKIDNKYNSLDNEPYQSADTKDLDVALAKAMGEINSIGFNATNPHYRSGYANLDAIMTVVRPVLSKYGLYISQQERLMSNGTIVLYTRVRHCGQWIESRIPIIPDKDNIQGYGSAISYHKRYSIMSLLGITCAQDNDDDDGESLMTQSRIRDDMENPRKLESVRDRVVKEYINEEEVYALETLLVNRPKLANKLLSDLGIKSLRYIPKDNFQPIRQKLQTHIQNNPLEK